MTVETVLAVLRISRETWNSIPKKDRKRILKAVEKGTFGRAREIAKAVLKPKKRKKSKTKSTKRRRRKKNVEWWQ